MYWIKAGRYSIDFALVNKKLFHSNFTTTWYDLCWFHNPAVGTLLIEHLVYIYQVYHHHYFKIDEEMQIVKRCDILMENMSVIICVKKVEERSIWGRKERQELLSEETKDKK